MICVPDPDIGDFPFLNLEDTFFIYSLCCSHGTLSAQFPGQNSIGQTGKVLLVGFE